MKLKGLNNQAWVTCVTTDQEVRNGIVLAKSLKRILSNRNTVVIASNKVSPCLRTFLYAEFDFVFTLDEERNEGNLHPMEFGKLFAWNLKSFEKCCFVSPNMMFLKNADEIFEIHADVNFACPEMDTSLSIFIFKPSLQTFDILVKSLRSGNETLATRYIQNWFYNQHSNLSALKDNQGRNVHIGAQFNRIINLQPAKSVNAESPVSIGDACIVSFLDDPIMVADRKSEIENHGLIERHAIKTWINLYEDFIKDQTSIKSDSGSATLNPAENDAVWVREPVAIIGMGCRYPGGANNVEEFWKLLFNGEDGTSNPPSFRWLREQSCRSRPECRKTNAGFLQVPVDEFDAKFFGISPKEVQFMDPQQRLLLEVIWEALEDAAVDPLTLRGGHAGVFSGSWTNDYKDILMYGGVTEFYRGYMGNSIGAAAARISFLLGLTGPSVATESGCSSAMVAVHMACRSLLLGETSMALACGVNLLLHPFDKDEMPMVISPDGHCKTFDAKADGFARGEGCGVLVLKRLSDAIKDGDNIWALIRGSSITQEGVSRSMGTPTVEGESLAMELALKDAQVDPKDVSYVETHGTGTVVGDPMEVAAIAKAYHSKEREEPLIIGSVKTNVGHTESCSGITGIMKTVLAMHHEMLPAHRNFESLNPSINLESVPAVIPLEPLEWKKSTNGKRRIAGVSSFGITGTDAHVIIEEPPEVATTKIISNLERPKHILKISAKTEEALNILIEKYKDNLEQSTSNLADICHTANTGRANFPFRAVVIGKDKEDMVNKIKSGDMMKQEIAAEDCGKVCFLFTGQGSQYPGMAQRLYDTSPVFQMHFDYCADLLKEMYGVKVRDVLWGKDRNETDVNRTIYSQTSIFCVEYALLKLWESWGIKPDYALGHSLGEFAAAVCAGILEPQDAIKLVAERSRLIDSLPQGKMLVIKGDKNTVDKHMKQFAGENHKKILDYAAINSSQQTVVAGDSEIILEFAEYLSNLNLKATVLQSSHAFHSRHMEPMLIEYQEIAETATKRESRNCEYISGMKGSIIGGESVNAEYWMQHTRQPVNFFEANKTAANLGCKIFIEVGPQPVLAALTMLNTDGTSGITCLPSLRKTETEWDTLLETLAKLYLKGVPINWNNFDELYPRKKVRLPHYPFIGKKYWPDLLAITGATIHPLLGSLVPNASPSKIFQNGFNLRCLDYVKDHAIGKTAIFPGAGYLEMSLAAGLATVECATETMAKPCRPMKVESLTILAPLALEESKTSQVQVVVDFTSANENGNAPDWNSLTIKISHRLDTKWLLHATALFTPIPSAEEIKSVDFDKENVFKLKEGTSDDKRIAQAYEKLASIGLKFGPTFQSLEAVWKDDALGMLAKIKVPPINTENGDSQQYIIHPAVLDAMIQAVMIQNYSDNLKKRLHVPISISKLLWLANPQGEELYVYTKNKNQGELSNQAILVDGSGTVIAEMSGIELIDTTVKAVEAVLEQQTSVMPDLWEETWRRKKGPMQHRLSDEALSEDYYSEEFIGCIEKAYNVVSEEKEKIFKTLEEFVELWMLNGLYNCGWSPEMNEKFTTEEIVKQLKIVETQTKFVNYIMQTLEELGYLKKCGITWEVIAIPPTKSEVHEKLTTIYTSDLEKCFGSTKLIERLGKNLDSIFQGRQSALSILFPEDTKNELHVGRFYVDYGDTFGVHGSSTDITNRRINLWRERMDGKPFTVRILEVGGGTGAYAHYLLPNFEKWKLDYEYTFTDISPAFFAGVEKRFEKYMQNIKFKKLNIEEDPIKQGFCPEYYDCIVATDVIHATRDISESLKNCRKLLRHGGCIDIFEMIERNRIVTFTFGLMAGFWRYEDFRTDHCVINKHEWERSLQQSGFEKTTVFPCLGGKHALITSSAAKNLLDMPSFTKKEMTMGVGANLDYSQTWLIFSIKNYKLSEYLQNQINLVDRKAIVIQPAYNSTFTEVSSEEFQLRTDTKSDFELLMETIKSRKIPVEGVIYLWPLDTTRNKQEEILQPYFYISQTIFNLKQKFPPKLCAITLGVTPIGDKDLTNFHSSTLWGFTKALRNENIDVNCRCIDIGRTNLSENEMKEVFCEIWSDDKESQVSYVNGSRHVARLQSVKTQSLDLQLPFGTNRFQLILPDTRTFADLTFGPLEPFNLEPEEIEVEVYATALNFRDVFAVLKPIKYFENLDSVGLDFSGVVRRVGPLVTKWKEGDFVFGVNTNQNALPSHVKLHERDVLKVPDRITLCEAATLPAVVATSYVCLVDVAKITKYDTVLIHTASGGVGLSAIEIAQNIGAKIIATAGSNRKQNYLRSLGIEHIFNSRNTDFGDQILEVTNGRGVDVVLNSLTSEGFKEASLKACAKGARFVEMSKLSVWEPEEVKKLRPDVKYTRVDLTAATQDEWRRLMKKLEDLASENIVNPIPYVRFDAVNIREALQYLQKAKHIGKVVCVMPQLRMEDGVYKSFTPMFSERSTYLITGGLGGIGFEVAKWMLKKGAKHILLASRNLAKSSVQTIINQLNTDGANIIPVQLDVGNYDQCKNLLERINQKDGMNLPPLRGIMHAAGTISDGLIANQEWSKLSSTFNAKIAGTLNLHELTKGYFLEHFVMFSSVVSLFGALGQCNHAAGNSFEDAIAHYRHSVGLCATTVNWGQWGEVGVAVEVDVPGVKPLSTLHGISALEYVMKMQRVQTAAMNVESFSLFSKIFPQTGVYLDESIWKADRSSLSIRSEEFWRQYDSKVEPSEKVEMIKQQLKEILRKILKLDSDEAIEDETDFQEMGMDSLMFVELKNSVQALVGDRVSINASALRDCNNPKLLSEKLFKLIEGDDSAIGLEEPPTMEEVNDLIREDCQLPESITAVGCSFKEISEVKTVLLTGVTGTLGPYILKELTQMQQIKEVYCLLRPNRFSEPQKRLEKALQFRDLLGVVDMDKVKYVIGNISKEKLGMMESDWDELSKKIDCICHCAVKVHHTQYYKTRELSGNMEDVRSVNVTGTKNILEFACQGQVKHLFMASTLTVTKTDEDGTLSEDLPDVADFDGVTTLAYPNSKFVAEVLLKTALERGIPGKAFRFPFISGDSKTGSFKLDHNHMMLRYLYILKSGVMPSTPMPIQVLPVDTCAKISLNVFFNEKTSSEFGAYHIIHPLPDLDQEFVTVAEGLGYSVELVDFDEFVKKLVDEPDDSPLSMFKEVYKKDEERMGVYTLSSSKSWLEGVENFWSSKKVSAVCPEFYTGLSRTMEYIERDLKFAKSEGWLQNL